MNTYVICIQELGSNGRSVTEYPADGFRRSAKYWLRSPGTKQPTKCYRPSLSRVAEPKDGWWSISLSGLDQSHLPLVSDSRLEWSPSSTSLAVFESEELAFYHLIKDDLETGFWYDIEGLSATDINQCLTYGRILCALRHTKMVLRRQLVQEGRIGRWD